MAYDADLLTTTSHRADQLTSASALALYDLAVTADDKLRAAAAMAHVLRGLPAAKPKRAKLAEIVPYLTAEALGEALKRACAIVDRRMTIPVLACVRLRSAAGKLTLYATDMDIEWRETLAADGLGAFDMCVPAHKLAAALKGLKGAVDLRDETIHPAPGATVKRGGHEDQVVDGQTKRVWVERDVPKEPDLFLALVAGGAGVRFPGLPTADFPVFEAPAGGPAAVELLPVERLLAPLRAVNLCVSAEETRYYLNGAYMHMRTVEGRRKLAFCATDGSRLMLEQGEDDCGLGEMPGVIIPRKTVEWMLRHLPAGDGYVEIWPTCIVITTDRGALRFKLIDGSFPDYTRAIPRGEDRKAVLQVSDPKAFAAALARVASQSSERSRSVVLRPDAVTGALMLHVRTLEGVTVEVEAPGVNYSGDGAALSFNAVYLRQMVEVGGPCLIALFSSNDPALFNWDDAPGRTAVLMPLRV